MVLNKTIYMNSENVRKNGRGTFTFVDFCNKKTTFVSNDKK